MSTNQQKNILVLLSTYNGQKFLEDQLDSLYDQKNTNVHCLVRDDGSSDYTLDILKKYQLNWKELSIIEGDNIGCAKSFTELLKYALEYEEVIDYFAFCDQDDVWLEDKMSKAVSRLDSMPQSAPLLYCSNLTLVDHNLDVISKMYTKKIKKFTKGNTLVERFGTGCTMVFNKQAVQFFFNNQPSTSILHDRWMYLICTFFGNIYYDDNSYILYRQHEANVVGGQHGIVDKWKSRLRSFKKLDENPREEQARELLEVFGHMLSKDDCELIKIVAEYRKNIKTKLRFFFAHPKHNLKMRSCERNFWLRMRILFESV